MKYGSILMGVLFVFVLPKLSFAEQAADIIKKIEANLNGKTAVMNITMIVKTKRTERTMKMASYSIGMERSFIKVLYPGKDKGITFLKIENTMWQYVPRIEKIIKIPASMMLQGWMGSDFSNDDLVKESSISDDYTHKLVGENEGSYTIELFPKEDAAVVWGKIIMEISKQYYLPTIVRYYDEDDILVRELTYTNVKLFGGRFYPSLWVMEPREPEKEGHRTIINIDDAVFDEKVSESYFTKRALKRYSD